MKFATSIKRTAVVAAVSSALALSHAVQAKKASSGGKAKEWYLQTVVTVEDGLDTFVDDRSGVIGRIGGASDGRDVHDIPLFGNITGTAAAVVHLKGEAWGADAGQYFSDYRPPGASKQTWTITVLSNRPGSFVTLSWDGFYRISARPGGGGYDTQLDNGDPVARTLSLVDLTTKEVVEAVRHGQPATYSFVMDESGERQFRWVQGDVDLADLDTGASVSVQDFAGWAGARGIRAQAAEAAPGAGNAGLPGMPPKGLKVRRDQPRGRMQQEE
jgi:hypothetical protein